MKRHEAREVAFIIIFEKSFQDETPLDEIPVCVRYRINGEETDEFPFPTELNGAEPVTETVPGWQQDISGVRRWEDLPEAARNYVEMIEKAIGCPITYISVGAERDRMIVK